MAAGGRSALLFVPSAVTGGRDMNLVVNPGHADARAIVVGPETPVTFDPRLFRRLPGGEDGSPAGGSRPGGGGCDNVAGCIAKELEMAVCTPKQAAFFDRMVPLFRPIAKRLGFDEDFLLALCAFEDTWGADTHNDKLHNLFGITQAGGSNLKFASDQACCDYWENHYGNTMTGSADFADFARRLRMLGYNSVNPAYDRNLSDTYRSVVAHKAACDVR